MVNIERAFREDDIGRAIVSTVEQEPGISERATVAFVAQQLQADEDEVWDMIGWFVSEHQIIRRLARGERRLFPPSEGFAIKRIFPRGSQEHI